MHIRLVPLDTRLGSKSLEQVASRVHFGLSFTKVTIELCNPVEYHGIYNPTRHPADTYRQFLARHYPKHTLAITSQPLVETIRDNTEAKEYVGLCWMDSGYAIAKTRGEFTNGMKATPAHKLLDTTQTIIHEILHWANINHHRQLQFVDDRLCPMMDDTLPWNTCDQPCEKCQHRFSIYATTRRRNSK